MNNCLVWALPRWLRNYLRGEALLIRRSKHNVFPHFMRVPCIKGVEIIEYTPIRPITKPLPVHALLYRGKVYRGPASCVCDRCREAS